MTSLLSTTCPLNGRATDDLLGKPLGHQGVTLVGDQSVGPGSATWGKTWTLPVLLGEMPRLQALATATVSLGPFPAFLGLPVIQTLKRSRPP